MNNKIAQKDYYNHYDDFDIIELGMVDGRENEYRKRFMSRRAEKMAEIAGLDDGSTILEVGCGTGMYTVYWVRPSIKLYGLDISRGMLKRSADKIDSINTFFIEGDAEHLPFRDRSFDAVLSVNTIEHLDDVRVALKEIARVCQDGGKIVLSVPNGNFSARYRMMLMQALEWFMDRIVKHIPKPAETPNDDFIHRDLTMDDLTGLLTEIGIRIEHRSFMGFIPSQVIPAKVVRSFIVMEAMEKVLEMIPWIRSVGGVIIIGGTKANHDKVSILFNNNSNKK